MMEKKEKAKSCKGKRKERKGKAKQAAQGRGKWGKRKRREKEKKGNGGKREGVEGKDIQRYKGKKRYRTVKARPTCKRRGRERASIS